MFLLDFLRGQDFIGGTTDPELQSRSVHVGLEGQNGHKGQPLLNNHESRFADPWLMVALATLASSLTSQRVAE